MSQCLPHLSRRKFMGLMGSAALATPVLGNNILGANDRVRLGLIGCGGKARHHIKTFKGIAGVEFVAVCDPDTQRMDECAELWQQGHKPRPVPDKIRDYRKLLERKDIDGVVLVTPNHWHALQSIHALQAGKHVYVEKPVTHDLHEGRQLVAAVERYGRIVQAGYQCRSDKGPIEGIRYVQEGGLGKILSVHVCCFRNRKSIGRQGTPLSPPSTLDYNLWLGPAQDFPLYRPQFHYDWHWNFNTGNGDMGNQCPHEIDLACWVLGDGAVPTSIRSFGNRFAWNDAGTTPNMLTAWYEQAGVPVTIEVNDLWVTPERNVPSMRDGVRVGIHVRCEGGVLRGGRGGMYVVGDDGKTRIQKFPGDGGGGHQSNFVDAIRANDVGLAASQLAVAERSAAISHLANISFLSGEEVGVGDLAGVTGDHAQLARIVEDQSAQLRAWDIQEPRYQLGREIQVDPATSTILTRDVDAQLIRKPGRGEFVLPEKV